MADVIKVAIGQISPALGNVALNFTKHLAYIETAKQSDVQLIVFPELGLTGYQVQDQALEVARTIDHPDIRNLIVQSQGIDIVFSFVEETPDHLFYISAVYASHGEVKHVHRKVYLPTYGMFDDRRYFAAGQSFQTFTTDHSTMGMMICEDAWHSTSPYLLALGGANIMVITAAGPARSVTDVEYFGSQKFWRQLVQMYAKVHGVTVVFVNRVGVEDGITFFGGSGVISAEGNWLFEGPIGEEGLFYATIDLRANRRARYITPLVRDERPNMVLRELQRILAGREGGVNL